MKHLFLCVWRVVGLSVETRDTQNSWYNRRLGDPPFIKKEFWAAYQEQGLDLIDMRRLLKRGDFLFLKTQLNSSLGSDHWITEQSSLDHWTVIIGSLDSHHWNTGQSSLEHWTVIIGSL